MLNEEKIRLMTDIAMFEKKNEKDMIPAGRYFKSDYISMWLLRSLLSYTAAFGLCLALWLLYQIEGIMSTMDLDAILRSAGLIGILYGTGGDRAADAPRRLRDARLEAGGPDCLRRGWQSE